MPCECKVLLLSQKKKKKKKKKKKRKEREMKNSMSCTPSILFRGASSAPEKPMQSRKDLNQAWKTLYIRRSKAAMPAMFLNV
jgi:hypothetical protein